MDERIWRFSQLNNKAIDEDYGSQTDEYEDFISYLDELVYQKSVAIRIDKMLKTLLNTKPCLNSICLMIKTLDMLKASLQFKEYNERLVDHLELVDVLRIFSYKNYLLALSKKEVKSIIEGKEFMINTSSTLGEFKIITFGSH